MKKHDAYGIIQDVYVPLGDSMGAPPTIFTPYTNNGVYFNAIAKTTKRTFVTTSGLDSVLGVAFNTWASDPPVVSGSFVTLLNGDVVIGGIRVAVGSLDPFSKPGWTFPSNFKLLDLSPGQNTQAVITAHSSIYYPKNQALRRFLIDEINAK